MARQRMGLSYQGCLNINNWNHLFSPNSASAQEGAMRCFDHWARTGPAGRIRRVGAATSLIRYPDASIQVVDPNQKMLEKSTLILLAMVAVYFLIIRQ